MVANIGLMWEQKQREDAERDANGNQNVPKAPKLTQQQMLDMIKRAREK